ncbi:T9SS type B sorting domain-containing protein [Mangrovimonas spongiae]|uniref:Lectin n=1 Tax=Mangrovimonas spongiae TaxID=2494697 RepID=A0A3R9MS37_9FLAO|nr:T9SS type B sorting domain-containing protein [Mangrovimonas spongiae]RSK39353.1 lectin [Mangrovimonas spongiae]
MSFSQNQPPNITATGNQIYCPLSQTPIVSFFNIDDPDDTTIEALYIQISTGYQVGSDVLELTGAHPNIQTSWDANQGKLTLTGIAGNEVAYTDLIAAVYDVVFESTTIDLEFEKSFSFTIGEANYLPSTGHYYEYVADVGVSWDDAKVLAENRTYYGLQGYLVTILSEDEAQLSGEQAAGTGWIGGSDAETEGEWKWVTGPESGTIFWNGGTNGSTPNFAFWNTGEPNNLGEEDYAHITAPGLGVQGSWNDLPNVGGDGDYEPKGYIVEYGGMPGDPTLNLSASTQLNIPRIINTLEAERCGNGTVTLEVQTSIGTVYWFSSEAGNVIATGNTFVTPEINETTTFYALATANNCLEGEKVPVTATVYALPEVNSPITFNNCDEDGIPDGFTNFNLNEIGDLITNGETSTYTISYYDDISNANQGINSLEAYPYNNINSSEIYVRVEGENGCFKVITVNLEISTTALPDDFLVTLEVCDTGEEGIEEFNLLNAEQDVLDVFPDTQNLSVHFYETLEDAQLELNEINATVPYTNQNLFSEVLYVRIEDDNGGCYGIGGHLNLVVQPKPEFQLDDRTVFCSNEELVALSIYNPQGTYNYEWLDITGTILGTGPTLEVGSGGEYFVIAENENGCFSDIKNISVVTSSSPNISYEDISITDFSETNSITINTQHLGDGHYEFSIGSSSGPYQDMPYFNNLPYGSYTLYVRDKNGCGMTELDFSILGHQKFFSPNGDNVNDTWNIKGAGQGYKLTSYITIYDRYGKMIQTITPFEGGWDGTLKGANLPSSDYWFMARMITNAGEHRILKGHFALIR